MARRSRADAGGSDTPNGGVSKKGSRRSSRGGGGDAADVWYVMSFLRNESLCGAPCKLLREILRNESLGTAEFLAGRCQVVNHRSVGGFATLGHANFAVLAAN